MVSPVTGSFAGYTAIAGIIVQTSQDEVLANLDKLKALIPDTTEGSSPAPSPEFDRMEPALGVQLLAEIDALKVIVDAAPVV